MSSNDVKAAAPQKVNNPAVFKVLDDGTVLYKTWEDAEAARQQKAAQQTAGTVKKPSQAKLGEQALSKDGTVAPYSLGALVEFQFTGLIVVILVLAGLSLICAAIGRLIKAIEQKSAVAPVPAAFAPELPATAPSGIHPGLTDQELVVILTAAASEIVGSPVKIERFSPLTAKDLNWSAQGRSQLHSHRLK